MLACVCLAAPMQGAENDVLPFFTARLFGLSTYGEACGSLLVMTLLGTAAGVAGFGLLHDATGGYGIALTVAALAQVGAAALFLSLRERA